MPRDDYAHCEALVRDADKDRFLSALFAPADRRPHLFALYAFNVEIARIREVTADVLPGEMRLQWWHDALSGLGHGEVMASPVANALLDTLAQGHVSAQLLIDLVEARRFDLYGEPLATVPELDTYARQTSSRLILTAARILGAAATRDLADAADHAGIAYGIAGLLSVVALHAARGQIFVPHAVLDHHGVRSEDILAGRSSAEWLAALAQLREHARASYAAFVVRAAELPAMAIPAFLPVALTPKLIARMEKRSYTPLAVVSLSPLQRQWTLWSAAQWGFG